MNQEISIGGALKHFRLLHELTLEKLAENLNKLYPDENFTKGKLSKWERDTETPKVTSLKRVADYFETTIDEILNFQIVENEYEKRLKENKYKNKIIDTLIDLGYQFDPDSFNFGEFIVDSMQIENTETNEVYYVDPAELYDSMEDTLLRIQKLKSIAGINIEISEVRKTLQELSDDRYFGELTTVYVTEKVAAGVGYLYSDNEQIPYTTDRTDLHEYDFATLVTGDSMDPKYNDGDVILVKSGYDNVNGDVYVIDYDGKSYVKKLYNDGDRFRLVSINKSYKNIIIEIPPENGKYFNIVGKVVDSFTPIN
ncbi:helix-turn-helix domain-containing protein [Peptostreptococcus equinus]|uniref:XRE family transcriptional regulator n=1 Tax=Peptostreptococcus equinus TaxID=3003601 RepID=A0ABY7JPX2_9FIRM|nr:XRE family transcriptional regulator [Peptostreptococcus sp. CBA3647]WAW15418.1 XRE family transcriptional regulator [Peptostreptococcus sp. CBA3647]